MDDFKAFYQSLTPEGRSDFANKTGTTLGYLQQLAYGGKRIELGLADVLVAASGGLLSLDRLNLTPRAEFQRTARVRKPGRAKRIKPQAAQANQTEGV